MNYLKPTTERLLFLCALAVLSLIWGCGGGGVSGDSQDPDPTVVDFPVAYIQRPLPLDEDGELIIDDPREPFEFNPGAALYLKQRASVSAQSLNISDQAFPAASSLYDVKDLSINDDGDKLLFAMRAAEIEDADDDEQPTWNIWQYDLETSVLERIIKSNTIAEEGQDIAPQYLPDGRIVFASTRQRTAKAILIDEGKTQFAALDEDRNQPAAALHVMDADGGNIEQITFNQSHDLDPVVLRNGKILFSRWDNAGNNDEFNLYQVDPNGHKLHFMYGAHSHDTNSDDETIQFTKPTELPSGEIVLLPNRFEKSTLGSDMLLIDIANFTEALRPLADAATSLTATQTSLTSTQVNIGDEPSLGGRFGYVFPLWDGSGRFLISWSDCRLTIGSNESEEEDEAETSTTDSPILPCSENNLALENAIEASPLFGLWMFDPNQQTQLPIVLPREGIAITETAVLAPKTTADYITEDAISDASLQDLADDGLGVLHIRSVYDFDGIDASDAGITTLADPAQTNPDQRPARFIRIVKAVSLPDDDVFDFDNAAFGRAGNQRMKEILGYAEIEPDGSVMTQVPANVAFGISILDKQGRRLSSSQRHQNWLQVRPGEILQCNGCHTQDSEVPHGRPDAEPEPINQGAPTTGLPFPNTNSALFANMGETMAQVRARINGHPQISVDINFADIWTDTDTLSAADPFNYNYSDLTTPAPVANSCTTSYSSICRIVVNYQEHIQPIWEANREITNELDELETTTCITCHSTQDSEGADQVPGGQINLSNTQSADRPDYVTSYAELFFNHNRLEIIDNMITDDLPVFDENGDPVFQTVDGELVLDDNGEPIPETQNIAVNPILSSAGAAASPDFFAPFATGQSHEGYLSAAELKLISEWLDIGGQYYNNPFDVPEM